MTHLQSKFLFLTEENVMNDRTLALLGDRAAQQRIKRLEEKL